MMEYASNGELFDYVNANEVLFKESIVRNIFQQILNGIIHIHSKGICHRDIKLSNIMISKDYKIKLIDFEYAIEMNGLLTERCGTDDYMPPEVIKGEAYWGDKADIFSLGVVLYTLCFGERPFRRSVDNFYESFSKNKTDFWEKLMKRKGKDIKEYTQLIDLLNIMMDKQPDNRPTAASILDH